MHQTLQYLRAYRKQLVLGPSFKFAEAVLELIVPLLVARMINLGVLTGDMHKIWLYGGISFTLAVSGMVCAVICQYMASVTSQGYGTKLRNALLEKILHLPQSAVDQLGTSSLAVRCTTDVQLLQQAVAMLIRLVVRAPFLCLGSLVMAISLNWRLATVFVVVLLLFATLLWLIMRYTLPLYSETRKQTDGLVLRLRELLQGVRIIRALGKENQRTEEFEILNTDLTQLNQRIGKVSTLLNPATQLLLNFAAIGVLFLASNELRWGRTNVGELVAFINYLGMMLLALSVVANLIILFTKAYSAALRIEAVLMQEERQNLTVEASDALADLVYPGEKSDELAKPLIKRAQTDAYAVEFKDVTFAYPQENTDKKSAKPLFQNFSFALRDGENLGVIGPTGAGKSSIAKLLVREYLPQAGVIKYQGKDISKDLSEDELLKFIQLVPQQATLFKGTIKQNLLLGNTRNVTDTELWQYLKLAEADQFVEQKAKGLESEVALGGRNFSGGQKQRLCLARTLLRHPQLLILDDSSSALDYVTDAKIWHKLTHFSDMQLIVISQRINTVRRCQRILVLDNGCICGFGTHEQLLNTCQVYQQIYESQRQVDCLDAGGEDAEKQ